MPLFAGRAAFKETDVASAATCDIGDTDNWKIRITGTTGITSFGAVANKLRFIRFAAALTLTHHATSLILPGGANITTAAGDACIAMSDASGNWRVYSYQASGETVFGRTLAASADAAAARTTLDAQQAHANLTAFSGLSVVANKIPWFNGSGTMTTADLTGLGRQLMASADAAEARGYLVAQAADGDLDALAALSGTNTIYYRSATSTWTAVTFGTGLSFSGGAISLDAELVALAGLTSAADKGLYFTGSGTAATFDLPSYGRTLVASASALLATRNLQAPYILAQSNTAVSHTGDTNETTLATVQIPAGAMGANGSVHIWSYWSYTNSANNKTPRIRFGGTGGQSYMAVVNTTTVQMQQLTIVRNNNATNSQKGFASGSNAGLGATSNAQVTSSVDTTAAVDIVFRGTLANSGETITLEGYSVEVRYAA